MSELTMARGSRGLLFLLLAGLFSPALVAQSYEERVDVRIIQVPVVVWKGAEPVSGLTAENFELFVNGERLPITYFDVLDFEGVEHEGTTSTHSFDQRRLTLLMFDLANASTFDLVRARASIQNIIEASSPDDYFGVAVYDGKNFSYLAPYTGDRVTVARAVKTLRQSNARDPLALAITTEERMALPNVPGLPTSTLAVEGGFSDDLITGLDDFDSTIEALSGRPIPSINAAVEADRVAIEQETTDSWMATLSRVAEDMVPLVGIKQVLLFSTGSSLGMPKPDGMAQVHDSFRRAGATLHVIDVGGLLAPPGGASNTNPVDNPSTPDVLFRASLGTGGRVIHGTAVSNAVRLFFDTRSVTYILGFEPPANERPTNDIDVKLRDQPMFTSLSFRRGYASDESLPKGVSGMMLADAILNDIGHNDVTMAIYADGKGTVDVGMPSDELLAHAVNGWVRLDVYLYIFDEYGGVVGWKHRKMMIDEREARPKLKGKELVRRERFTLEPGKYVAKAIVTIDKLDLVSFRRKDFVITTSAADAGRPSGF